MPYIIKDVRAVKSPVAILLLGDFYDLSYFVKVYSMFPLR